MNGRQLADIIINQIIKKPSLFYVSSGGFVLLQKNLKNDKQNKDDYVLMNDRTRLEY